MTVGIFINWGANWLVAFSFPHLLEYTQPFTFLIFVTTAIFFLYFTLQFVPETKGLTVCSALDMLIWNSIVIGLLMSFNDTLCCSKHYSNSLASEFTIFSNFAR